MAADRPACAPSLSGRVAAAIAAAEALEEALRTAANALAEVAGQDSEAWQQLERGADSAMTAAGNLRMARSYVRGAALRGAEIL